MANGHTSGPSSYLGTGGCPHSPKALTIPSERPWDPIFQKSDLIIRHPISFTIIGGHGGGPTWIPVESPEFSETDVLFAQLLSASPHSTPPWKWRHEDNQRCMPSCSAYPCTRGASGTKTQGHLPHIRGRRYSSVYAEKEYDQEVLEIECRKPQQNNSNAGHRQSPHYRNQLDVSCSTTRSSSGSRRDSRPYGEVQVQSMSSTSSSDAAVPASPRGVLHGSQPKEKENTINSRVQENTAAAAATADDVAAQAAADISEMTEAEVRVYALQMQTLTQVLIRNMKCLYSTARAETDRKDQRFAVQEREITSLKHLLTQPSNDS